jgi:hypothetical protein
MVRQSDNYTINESVVGCKDRDVFDRTVRLLIDKDKDAYNRLILAGVLSGQCRIFEPGQVVFLEDYKMFSGLKCVRPKGETTCFWTFSEAVVSSR